MPEIKFRIIVEDPLQEVSYAVQRGKSDLLPPVQATGSTLVFEFPLTVADLDAVPPRLTGKYAQGPPGKRFVYVNSGSKIFFNDLFMDRSLLLEKDSYRLEARQ